MATWLIKDTKYGNDEPWRGPRRWAPSRRGLVAFATKAEAVDRLKHVRAAFAAFDPAFDPAAIRARFRLIRIGSKGGVLRAARVEVLAELSARTDWTIGDIEIQFDKLLKEIRRGEWPKGAK